MNTFETVALIFTVAASLTGLGYLAMAVWITSKLENDIHKDDRP